MCYHGKGKSLEKGSKRKSVLLFQTIDSVVTNDSLQALVKQFYGLTIAYDEVTNTDQNVVCLQPVNSTVSDRGLQKHVLKDCHSSVKTCFVHQQKLV